MINWCSTSMSQSVETCWVKRVAHPPPFRHDCLEWIVFIVWANFNEETSMVQMSHVRHKRYSVISNQESQMLMPAIFQIPCQGYCGQQEQNGKRSTLMRHEYRDLRWMVAWCVIQGILDRGHASAESCNPTHNWTQLSFVDEELHKASHVSRPVEALLGQWTCCLGKVRLRKVSNAVAFRRLGWSCISSLELLSPIHVDARQIDMGASGEQYYIAKLG